MSAPSWAPGWVDKSRKSIYRRLKMTKVQQKTMVDICKREEYLQGITFYGYYLQLAAPLRAQTASRLREPNSHCTREQPNGDYAWCHGGRLCAVV